jgi:hypothetical protein
MNSRNRGRASRLVVLLFSSIMLPVSGIGCSPEGTGTVDVKGPDKVGEKLSKGAPPVASKGGTDDMGVKFRKRGGD